MSKYVSDLEPSILNIVTQFYYVDADTYYIAFPNDRLSLKLLVYGVSALEAAQTIITTKDAFDTFVTNRSNDNSLDSIRMLWFTFPIFGGLGKLRTPP